MASLRPLTSRPQTNSADVPSRNYSHSLTHLRSPFTSAMRGIDRQTASVITLLSLCVLATASDYASNHWNAYTEVLRDSRGGTKWAHPEACDFLRQLHTATSSNGSSKRQTLLINGTSLIQMSSSCRRAAATICPALSSPVGYEAPRAAEQTAT